MFTENEIANFIADNQILTKTRALKDKFIKKEAEFLEIRDHDFLAMVMLTPKVGLTKADGNINLFEEINLNKKARKLSKGGYFLKKDPVVKAMQFLIKDYEYWEHEFLQLIGFCITRLLEQNKQSAELLKQLGNNSGNFLDDVWHCPYFFIRIISSLILDEDEDIIKERTIKKEEFDKIQSIAAEIGLDKIAMFNKFCQTYSIKK